MKKIELIEIWMKLIWCFFSLARKNTESMTVLIQQHLPQFVTEVGAAGRLEVEMGIVRGNTRWLPDAHPQQIADTTHLGHRQGPKARTNLYRSQRQRWASVIDRKSRISEINVVDFIRSLVYLLQKKLLIITDGKT